MFKWRNLIAGFLNVMLGLSFGADTAKRVFKVLAEPGEGVVADVFSRASDLTASLDKLPYTVRSVEPLKPGEGRTVIVVDFSANTPANDACLLAEALSTLGRIHETPPPVLVAVGDSRFRSHVTIGPGRDLDVYAGGDLQVLTSECESGHSPESWKLLLEKDKAVRGSSLQHFGSGSTFEALRNSFTSQDAPVRVFWLAEGFDTFVYWKTPFCLPVRTRVGCQDVILAPPFEGIERISESDLTFFPIVFGERHGGRLREPSRRYIKGAEALAGSTGGFVSIVSGSPGDTLVHAFERSRAGVVLTLEGPVTTGGVGPAKARTLQISAGDKGHPVTWRRPFVVNPEGSIQLSTHGLEPMSVHSANLGLRYGCQAPDASAGEPSLELTLPPEVVNSPSGQMDIELGYPNE